MRKWNTIIFIKQAHHYYNNTKIHYFCRGYHSIPFLELHKRTTGSSLPDDLFEKLKKKHPKIENLTHKQLNYTLLILKKFNINALQACKEPHVFVMNPIALDNYGEILKECGFIKIEPFHIVRYRTVVSKKTILQLKNDSLLRPDAKLEDTLLKIFDEWPTSCKTYHNFPDNDTSILTIRISVLERYLNWKLQVTSDEFKNYCRNYLPLKHKPMSDIKEAINIAQNDINFDEECIRRNGFIISSDPINTKQILENVGTIAGLNIREVLVIEPAIIKNNCNALIEIRNILQEYNIPADAQRRCLRVYCMNPKTVKQRLEELSNLKEYQILYAHPRVLSMVVHKSKVISRLNKIETAKKKCYSLNHLVSSSNVFNNYINSFGEKVCLRDIVMMINSSLIVNRSNNNKNQSIKKPSEAYLKRQVMLQLRRHKYCLRSALSVIDENIRFLKERFDCDIILNNCQLLLYPNDEVKQYLDQLMALRNNETADSQNTFEVSYNVLAYNQITDEQVLSLVLYEIEKKYHFTDHGIWARQDNTRIESQSEL